MDGSSLEYDSDTCTALQREEWEVLESIHPDCLSGDPLKGLIRLEVPVDLPDSTEVLVTNDRSIETGSSSTSQSPCPPRTLSLTTLPPILLDVCLPSTYPYTPPQIRAVHATYSWLSLNGPDLRELLAGKWEEGQGVLYIWVESIRSGEFLDDLGMRTTTKGRPIVRISHPTPALLYPSLEGYNSSTQAARFSQNSYECEVCMTSIKGARCVMLSCSHVFCRSCLEDFWGLCIREGDVGRVGCPDPECVKEHREATEEEVRRVVTEEEILRWKWLRMKRALEKDPTLVHCPMALCQTPVSRPQNVEDGSPWERLRTCPECGYSFCAYCKRTWHGPVANCPISATKAILQEYMALAEGSSQRKMMEARYGRSTLQRLVTEYEEERAFHEWLERCTGTPCPGCDLRVEKHSGCNHMTCIKCGQHYCYRCGERLDRWHPYKHFSTPGLRCFSKLFDFESIDNEWQPVEGFDVI
ncbi:RWD-domain-containing protein [Lentinus tigrinus ALCF2SS1-6]|uniref:RBR-type E3 ubiquitin transferase n=1 Tax=Lentinus tigrinus ALCF2SS1-6 TaxID=1328759 RepID=A0A5C2SNX6_9APHY|nr:RWD-domain-containing protein [Lentinus tigrinus ALCF2SS1-6]